MTALDGYLQAVLGVQPRPVVVDAFFESDIHQCGRSKGENVGFDVVFVDSPQPSSEESWSEVCRTVQTSASSYEDRCAEGASRCAIFQASDGMVLSVSAPPLNGEQYQGVPQAAEAQRMLDAVGVANMATPSSKSARGKGGTDDVIDHYV